MWVWVTQLWEINGLIVDFNEKMELKLLRYKVCDFFFKDVFENIFEPTQLLYVISLNL